MVYKSEQIFLSFCHNPRVWQTDGQTDGQTDRQTDRQTEFLSLDRVCIPCSAVDIRLDVQLKNERHSLTVPCVFVESRIVKLLKQGQKVKRQGHLTCDLTGIHYTRPYSFQTLWISCPAQYRTPGICTHFKVTQRSRSRGLMNIDTNAWHTTGSVAKHVSQESCTIFSCTILVYRYSCLLSYATYMYLLFIKLSSCFVMTKRRYVIWVLRVVCCVNDARYVL